MFVPFDSELMGSSHISGGKKWARAISEKADNVKCIV